MINVIDMEDPKFIEWGKKYIVEHHSNLDAEITAKEARAFASEAWNEGKKQNLAELAKRISATLDDTKMPPAVKGMIGPVINRILGQLK